MKITNDELLKLGGFGIVTLGVFGWLAPALVSAASTLLVLIGLCIIGALGAVGYVVIYPIVLKLMEADELDDTVSEPTVTKTDAEVK